MAKVDEHPPTSADERPVRTSGPVPNGARPGRPTVHLAPGLLPAMAFFLLAALLRFPTLGCKPYWIAEIQEFSYAWRDDTASFLPFAAGDMLGFLYQKCCALTGLPLEPWVVRGLSALTGSLLPPALFLLLRARGRSMEGAVLALLASVSLPLIAASQEARYYIGMTFFLALGQIVDLFPSHGDETVEVHRPKPAPGEVEGTIIHGSPPAFCLGILDALALLCHPYALLWIGVRWAVRRPAVASLFPLRLWIPHVVPVLLALSIQAVQIAAAYGRFRTLHQWFRLEEYPPGFDLLPELAASLAGGTGGALLLLVGLAATGIFLLSADRPVTALRLLALFTVGPVVVTTAIWLARSRFSFTHLLPAAIPFYLSAAVGITQLARQAAARIPRSTLAVPAGALAVLLAFQPFLESWRFICRPTRLELGAGVAGTCRFLADNARPGDIVVTRYDKYFTAFAYYCGPLLKKGVTVAVPEIPDDPFFLAFNHLFPDGPRPERPLPERPLPERPLPVDPLPEGPSAPPQPPLLEGRGCPQTPPHDRPTDRTCLLGEALRTASPQASVFLVVPYFEDVEGTFNEWHGWLDSVWLYGREVGPGLEVPVVPYVVYTAPLMRVLRFELPAPRLVYPPAAQEHGDAAIHRLEKRIQSVIDAGRPLR